MKYGFIFLSLALVCGACCHPNDKEDEHQNIPVEETPPFFPSESVGCLNSRPDPSSQQVNSDRPAQLIDIKKLADLVERASS